MSTELKKREPKAIVPLADAARTLAELTNQIDEGADLNEALLAAFNETRLDLVAGVDRRIGFLRFCSGVVQSCKDARDAYIKRIQQVESMVENLKGRTIEIMKANPDLPYTGELGRLAIQKNPPSAKFAFETRPASRTISDEDMIAHGIDTKYTRLTYVLNTDVVKEDLKNGVKLPWATTEQGEHLRIRE